MKRGKLFVIEGIDGAGKATQTRLLTRRLKREGFKVVSIDFPRYKDQLFGRLLGEYIRGRFGDFVKTDPRIASILYAADRFEAKERLLRWLANGHIIIADRYVSANQMHQGGKIRNARKRKTFLRWLDEMEHGVFGIPRPTKIVYLDMPVSMSKTLLTRSRRELAQKKKKYLRGRRDILEGNKLYLENSRRAARALAREHKNWVTISCVKRGELRSPRDIHEEIWRSISKGMR